MRLSATDTSMLLSDDMLIPSSSFYSSSCLIQTDERTEGMLNIIPKKNLFSIVSTFRSTGHSIKKQSIKFAHTHAVWASLFYSATHAHFHLHPPSTSWPCHTGPNQLTNFNGKSIAQRTGSGGAHAAWWAINKSLTRDPKHDRARGRSSLPSNYALMEG